MSSSISRPVCGQGDGEEEEGVRRKMRRDGGVVQGPKQR